MIYSIIFGAGGGKSALSPKNLENRFLGLAKAPTIDLRNLPSSLGAFAQAEKPIFQVLGVYKQFGPEKIIMINLAFNQAKLLQAPRRLVECRVNS
jgi:hypothetical protein